MAEPLRLLVWTPSEVVLEADPVEWVHVELANDQTLTIWPGHLPMLGESRAAPLSYVAAGTTHSVDLPPGIVQVQGRTVTLFLGGTLEEQIEEQIELPAHLERLTQAVDVLPQGLVNGS